MWLSEGVRMAQKKFKKDSLNAIAMYNTLHLFKVRLSKILNNEETTGWESLFPNFGSEQSSDFYSAQGFVNSMRESAIMYNSDSKYKSNAVLGSVLTGNVMGRL